MKVTHFPAKTIVHECVHWDQHRKAFELERLYNRDSTQIKCLVIGGSKGSSDRTAADWMEWQANSLAPRIQMPIGSFKIKAAEYVRKFQREMKATHIVDVMEAVIDALATFFIASRHVTKMRMADAGYEEAIGAFTYIDGHYVKPHAFKKGSLQKDKHTASARTMPKSSPSAGKVLNSVASYFSGEYDEQFATDIGDWVMEITNVDGNVYKFRGSLCALF